MSALAPSLTWIHVGDHDFERGGLAHDEATFAEADRPEAEVIADHRWVFLDIVSAGAGGPDVRLTRHHRDRLIAELARAEAEQRTAVVFMHAYPGDLAAGADEVARVLADGRAAFVDTGHAHYNDGREVYGATRSTSEIAEGDGVPGFAIITVHDRIPNWRSEPIGGGWPIVQIVAPADLRLVTRPADPAQVPRPGDAWILAKLFGDPVAPVTLRVDGGPAIVMEAVACSPFWAATVALDAGLHRIEAAVTDHRDVVETLVRGADDVLRRRPALALGRDVHAIGAWPERDVEGTRLGPNKNGLRW